MIVKRTEVKEYLKNSDLRLTGDLIEKLDKKVREILDKASNRAERNQRKTVMSHDL